MSLKTKSYSHQSRLFVAVSVLFLCVRPEIRQKFIQFLLRNFFWRFSIFYPLIFWFNFVPVCQECITTAFLVAFLVFSESLPSIKFCISSSDNLEKRFLLASLGSIIDHRWLKLKTGSVLRSAPVNQADVSTCKRSCHF